MTFPTWYALEGALITTGLGCLALYLACQVAVWAREARRWRRYVALFVNVPDPEARALEVLRLAEATAEPDPDAVIKRGFRAAKRWGFLTEDDTR